jgi:hypothetical protein
LLANFHLINREGVAANSWLLYLAYKFRGDQSNANARRIFVCSLWYLPLLLGAFVFHSKNLNLVVENVENENKSDDQVISQTSPTIIISTLLIYHHHQHRHYHHHISIIIIIINR